MEKRNLDPENPIVRYLYLLSYFSECIKNSIYNRKSKGTILSEINSQYDDFEYMSSEEVLSTLNSKNEKGKEFAKNLIFDKIFKELNLDLEKVLDVDLIFNTVNQVLSNIEEAFKNKMNLIRCIDKIYIFMIESYKLFYLICKMLKKENKTKNEKLILLFEKDKDKYEKKAKEETIENNRLNKEINSLKELISKISKEFEMTLEKNKVESELNMKQLMEKIHESEQKIHQLIKDSEQKTQQHKIE